MMADDSTGRRLAPVRLSGTVLLHDIADLSAMNEVYARYFTGNCPARAAFSVKDLPKGALVEIEAVAVR